MIYRRRFSNEQTEVRMVGAEVREIVETLLPTDEIERLCRELGVVERERKLDVTMFIRMMVLSAGTPSGARQADVLRVTGRPMGTQRVRAKGNARGGPTGTPEGGSTGT